MARLGLLVAAIARARRQAERWSQLMAQFEELNGAIDALSESVDNLVSRLEDATVEDPAIQQQVDEAVARIKEVQGRIDGIGAGSGETPAEGEPPTASQLPADTGPQVEHRKGG